MGRGGSEMLSYGHAGNWVCGKLASIFDMPALLVPKDYIEWPAPTKYYGFFTFVFLAGAGG